MSETPPVAQLILGSSDPGVEDSGDVLFTRHTFFVSSVAVKSVRL
jgi:hypothetical protein